ncbi:hypothetical protein KIW84_040402 [Lathyrus oleraceus]|uniref:Uncharacterized protein n=1 Tax=Pisum sativum TaxID=3888 RepID=A0A9D4X584_PEA|nr:hypothetical protein KIW84_040402 [Pisum sativum]
MATDSRERTLEALERRIHTEHILFEKKKPINEDRKSPILAPSVSNVSSLHLCHPSSDTLNKDIEDGSEYAQLSVTLNENLLTTNGEFSAERGGSVHGILHELLQKGDAAVKRNQLAQCLLGADLHVVDGKAAHFTGIGGIMIHETAEAFGIVTEENKFRVVPKKGSVFVIQVDCWKVTLHGDKLDSRKVGL